MRNTYMKNIYFLILMIFIAVFSTVLLFEVLKKTFPAQTQEQGELYRNDRQLYNGYNSC